MAQNNKTAVTDYDKSVAAALIAGGIIVPLIAVLLLAGRALLMSEGDIADILPFALGVFAVGLIFVIAGFVKYVKYRAVLDEFETYRYSSKKLKATVVRVNDGMPTGKKGNVSPVVVAVCTATDETTGETKYFYSHKIMTKTNIKDKIVDVYVYPTGAYRVDFNSVRVDAPEGIAVRDFRK